MAKKEEFFTSLDLGTYKTVVTVGTRDQNGQLQIIGFGNVPTVGLRKGMVVDIEETVTSISNALELAERMSGIPISRVIVNVGGGHINSLNSKGAVAVGRADNEINTEDVDRAEEAAQAISMPSNREILHVVPRNFTVDGQEGIKDPIGMNGIRLEVEAHIITGSIPVLRNLNKCVTQAGLIIDDRVVGPLAAASGALSKRQKELGTILIDLGAGTTGIAVFEEGNILHTAILPVGSSHITNDIAIGLRASIDVAEKIKIVHGEIYTQKPKERITLQEFSDIEEGEFSRKELAYIIQSRLAEIFQLIKKELSKIGKDGMLPAGVVLVGGGAYLNGIVDFAKEKLRLPAQIGSIEGVSSSVDKVLKPEYAVSIGLLNSLIEDGGGPRNPGHPKNVFEKVKKMFDTFLP